MAPDRAHLEVRTQPLTAEAFAPFGAVVSAGLGEGSVANQGTAVRYSFGAGLESTRATARPNLCVYRSVARSLPLELTLLERHPCSSQAFLPMLTLGASRVTAARLLVCVAPALADGSPDVDALVAFVAAPGQGVNYRLGVWHHPIVALDAAADLAMLAWEDGTALDCVECPLAEPVRVVG